ncbi:MAG: dTDP-glucose 4,6-dehydratase [Planctomycetes bacterium]|nr:dTDP-glucose 4,6-dehydratase [Planctomycetota bacterium]
MNSPRRVLVTGGAGFIGSSVVRHLLEDPDVEVLNFDSLTYAANLLSLQCCADNPHYRFQRGDICDLEAVQQAFTEFHPTHILHLAAESHVDRSLTGPEAFIKTNVLGTGVMLQVARDYFDKLSSEERENFRFLHVSTDEVFGSLGDEGQFQPDTPYDPSSPYSASKAGSDHLVRAWGRSFGLPVLITNCSNNYGPCQFPEKLIPLMILNAKEGIKLPVYGKGDNVRDWLYVEDHARAIWSVAQNGKVGGTYLVGGEEEHTNLDVVETICNILDEEIPHAEIKDRKSLIEFVTDRPGHDFRYAIDSSATCKELGWAPQESFETGLRRTIRWYLENDAWLESIRSGAYREWMEENYAWR